MLLIYLVPRTIRPWPNRTSHRRNNAVDFPSATAGPSSVRERMIALIQRLIDQAEQAAPYGQDPMVILPPQALDFWCSSPQSRAAQALPVQRGIYFKSGSLKAFQIVSGRQSYINALLIASRGVVGPPCGASCQADRTNTPFVQCVRLPGHWNGCCANCKWRDWGSHCPPVRRQITGGTRMAIPGRSDMVNTVPRAPVRPSQPGGGVGRPILLIEDGPAGESEENPIDLDPEPGSQENPYEID
ncbi:hypothetical protein UA08_04289 [Talaromyces atroroseus]|uniref:Uncharacterized protein n=1 Tax=Talaromyces atroroseus TaxID=1441469 RepID=A0A1Q5Q8R2_TALAT|nr:hypothetical protein UA08_09518 [Talaromyces atroroseus]XP_020115333.1 hypothetical protein UA08_09517 [Talaromyces atroroseus]XP_020116029.1 hypothetical protein UA08_08801 [Talaromyces atroroseus]XP_020120638.1 hypothetical protein UA08_04289 [Talaromyces atroroseus]OKL55211.1 hypothetical protein UA08_09518 [Talaromyces atroroseus]OKL55212.1 hypothetical protein UA08_09517 [Talaromyces atroroseus]OKL55908.1 hypothetical protein UA08_08801 [Talaromyces atroroseus]OKL60517.1 hypothetical